MAQIPWATAQADRSREELRRLYLDENGLETQPIPTSKEEELLASLLGANQDLLEAFRIYDDLELLGVAEQEEREVAERSRKETKLDRTVCLPYYLPCKPYNSYYIHISKFSSLLRMGHSRRRSPEKAIMEGAMLAPHAPLLLRLRSRYCHLPHLHGTILPRSRMAPTLTLMDLLYIPT